MNNEAAPSYFNGGTYIQYTDYRYATMEIVVCRIKETLEIWIKIKYPEIHYIYPNFTVLILFWHFFFFEGLEGSSNNSTKFQV